MKKIMPVILIGASLITNINIAHAAKKTDSTSDVWEDSQSKEWGNTPESVKYVLSNVQISRSQGNSGGKQTDLFSTKWLKEMQRSPSTYRLTDADKKWVDNVLSNAEAKNSNTWKPGSKTPTVSKTAEVSQPAPSAIASKKIEDKKSNETTTKTSSSFLTPPKEEKSRPVSVKETSSRNKAESRPLPSPKIEKQNNTVAAQKIESPKVEKVQEQSITHNGNDEKTSEKQKVETNKNTTENKSGNVVAIPVANKDITPQPQVENKSEEDKFIDSLPKVSDEDGSSLDKQHEEMSLYREYTLENNIQKTLEKEDDVIPEVKLFENIPVTNKNISESQSKKELKEENNTEKTTQEVKVENKSDITKEPEVKNIVEQKQLDNGWITSALTYLGSIAFIMLFVFVGWTVRLKKTGKLNKYI